MQEYAIESYKDNGFQNILLLTKKFGILTRNIGDYSWDSLTLNIMSNTVKKFEKEIQYITNYFYYSLLILNIIFGIYLWKYRKHELLSVLVLFVGRFAILTLAIEVSSKYFLLAMITLVVCASLALNKLITKEDVK